jgi:transposase
MTREVNALKGLLRAAGLGRLCRSLRTEAAWEKLLLALGPDPPLRGYGEMHRALWRGAKGQVEALEEELWRQRAPFAEALQRLQTVPAVGEVVALTAVAVLSDVKRFPTCKHAASYAGLVPSTHQSGERDRRGPITKRGSGELRAMLCQAAHHARRPQHPLHPYFAKVCARRGYKMAIVAVAHRLLRILYALWRDGSDFDVGRLGVEVGPFQTTRTRLYRLRPKAQGAP